MNKIKKALLLAMSFVMSATLFAACKKDGGDSTSSAPVSSSEEVTSSEAESSNEASSNEASSNEASSDEASSDEASSDEASSDEASSDEASSDEASSEGSSETPGVETSVAISGGNTVMEFETLQLSARLSGMDEDLAVVWDSSEKTVATVDENGLVTALKAGTTKITASVNDGGVTVSASIDLTVTKTNLLHEIKFSVDSLNIYEGELDQVQASVTYDGETLDDEDYAIEYTWEKISGDDNVVSLQNDGGVATITALSAGNVVYKVSTTVRGYEVSKEIEITVMSVSYSCVLENKNIAEVEGGYKTVLQLSDTETVAMEIGKAYGTINGEPTEDEVQVAWVVETNDGAISLDGDTLTALKAGEAVLKGTTSYEGEEINITLTVVVSKAEVALADKMTLETYNLTTFTLPSNMKGEVVKVSVDGENVLFDKANEKGSIAENVITVDVDGIPAKNEQLGKGKTMTIETSTTIYTATVDVYTMVINTAEELDQWQAAAADNSVKAGYVIEEQKLAYLSGYFILGDNIEYNKVWTPIIPHAGANPSIYNLCNQTNTNVKGWIEQYGSDKVIAVNGWTQSDKLGFHGTFDGDGHYINGMETSGTYSAFVIVAGDTSVMKNIAFTNAKVGSKSGLLNNRGSATLENIYIELVSMESGNGNDTTALFGARDMSVKNAKNVLIDASKCDFSKVTNSAYLASLSAAVAEGVYVIGAEELEVSTKEAATVAAFWGYDASNDVAGSFVDAKALLADEVHGAIVKEWGDMWFVDERGIVIPTSVMSQYGGDVTIENTEASVPANSSFTVFTNQDGRYIVYSLKEAVAGISVEGNVISVAGEAIGTSFTVVATSLIDGKTAEKSFTVGKMMEKVTAENTVDVNLGMSIVESAVVMGETANVDLSEIFDAYLKGQTVTVKYGEDVVYEGVIDSASWAMPLDKFTSNDSGEATLVFTYETQEKAYELTLPIQIDNRVELNSTNVANPTALRDIIQSNMSASYVLTSNLNMSGLTLAWIKGDFTGTIDGNGYGIVNTTLASYVGNEGGYKPAFIVNNYGTLKNIRFEIADLNTSGGSYDRGLVAYNYGTVSNVYVDFNIATLSTRGDAQTEAMDWMDGAGLVRQNAGTVENCIVKVTQMAGLEVPANWISGLITWNQTSGKVFNSYVITGIETVDCIQVDSTQKADATQYTSWEAMDTSVITAENGFSNAWSVVDGAVYFGSLELYDGITAENTVTLKKSTEVNLNIGYANSALVMDTSSMVELDLSEVGTIDSFKSLTFKGAAVAVNYADGKLTVPVSAFGTAYGENSLSAVVKTADGLKKLTIPVLLITNVITTAEELQNFGHIAKLVGSKDLQGGYFTLGQNIDFSTYNNGVYIPFEQRGGGNWGSPESRGFVGVFDGCGYTISNMTVGDATTNSNASGFIPVLHTNGVIRNVGFVNAKANMTGLNAFLTSMAAGTIENIYVDFAFTQNGGSAVLFKTDKISRDGNGPTVKDVYVYMKDGTYGAANNSLGATTQFYAFGGSTTSGEAVGKYEGAYAIVAHATNNVPYVAGHGGALEGSVYGAFLGTDALAADEAAQAEMATWNTAYWTIVDGVPVWNSIPTTEA